MPPIFDATQQGQHHSVQNFRKKRTMSDNSIFYEIETCQTFDVVNTAINDIIWTLIVLASLYCFKHFFGHLIGRSKSSTGADIDTNDNNHENSNNWIFRVFFEKQII